MNVYLIRHAQSLNNALPEHKRVEDPGLTELGIQQAQQLAQWIVQLKLTRLYVSPFLRTLQTAEPVAQATGLIPEVRIDIHEVGGCYGGYGHRATGRPGMNRAEIQTQFPTYQVHQDLPHDGWWGCRPREDEEQATKRAVQVLHWIQTHYGASEHRVGIITHADFKTSLLALFHPLGIDTPYNTSVTTLAVDRNTVTLVDYNGVRHLDHKQLTL